MSSQKITKQTTNSPKKLHIVFAIIIAAVSIAAFFIPLQRLTLTESVWSAEYQSLYAIFGSLFKSDAKLFGFLPVLGHAKSIISLAYTLGVWCFAIALIAALVLAILSFCIRDKAAFFVHLATYVFTGATAVYSLMILLATAYLPIRLEFDFTTMFSALFGAVVYFIMMRAEKGKDAWFSAAHFAFSLLTLALLSIAVARPATSAASSISLAHKLLLLACVLLLCALLAFIAFFVFHKKNAYINIYTALFQSLVITAIVTIAQYAKLNSTNFAIFTMLAAIITVLQILFNSLHAISIAKAQQKEAVTAAIQEYVQQEEQAQQAQEEVTEVAESEQPAEVYTAEEVAEEETETVAAESAETTETTNEEAEEGSDVYPDPFLATLTDEERKIFFDLYILKTEGMPEIPVYEICGNNKRFFRRAFIYLGQYRDKVPASLLVKMYEYSLTL